MAELLNPAELPSFAERLSRLAPAVRTAAAELQALAPGDTYLPAWEKLHAEFHSLKGVMQILAATSAAQEYISAGNELLKLAIREKYILPDPAPIHPLLAEWADNCKEPEHIDSNWQKYFAMIRSHYTIDLPHSERLALAPTDMPYVDEFVSKRLREAERGNYNIHFYTQKSRLSDLPKLREKIDAHLIKNPGFLISFLPLVNGESGTELTVNCWLANREKKLSWK